MDIWQPMTNMLWIVLAGTLVLALLRQLLRSNGFKGWLGERKVRRWLARDLDPAQYFSLHNVTLRLSDGSTTQIDHVVFSNFGVFVLETKHMQGWIFGTAGQRTWTQSIYRHRSSFPNPILQNWRHIKALEAMLHIPLQHLHSVIVFTGDSSFKTAMPAHVTQGRGCINYIRSISQPVWDSQHVQQLYQQLKTQRMPANRATHQAHLESLRERHSPQPTYPSGLRPHLRRTAAKEAPTLPQLESLMRQEPALDATDLPTSKLLAAPPTQCPQCDAPTLARSLVDNTGHTRYFTRCSRYPHCRYLVANPDTDSLEVKEDVSTMP